MLREALGSLMPAAVPGVLACDGHNCWHPAAGTVVTWCPDVISVRQACDDHELWFTGDARALASCTVRPAFERPGDLLRVRRDDVRAVERLAALLTSRGIPAAGWP
jgi:hypothetical protein